jgi:hypothetical protein
MLLLEKVNSLAIFVIRRPGAYKVAEIIGGLE